MPAFRPVEIANSDQSVLPQHNHRRVYSDDFFRPAETVDSNQSVLSQHNHRRIYSDDSPSHQRLRIHRQDR